MVLTIEVPKDQIEKVRACQSLKIKDGRGEIVHPSEDIPPYFSGFWFKKISVARPN